MSKSETLKKLKSALGLPPDTQEFDPVLFSLKLAKNIEKLAGEIKVVNEKIAEHLSADEKRLAEQLTTNHDEMVKLQNELLKAIQERRIEKVQVERVIERPADKMTVDLKYPDQTKRDDERRGLFGKIKDAVGDTVTAINTVIEEIRFSRKEGGAIATRLVTADGKDFYNAIMTVVGGGGISFTDAVLNATLVTKTVDFTASQTKQAIWTPASGKKFVITDYHLSFSAAGAITVFDGETNDTDGRVFKYNGAANGGANHAYRKPRKSTAADNKLYYTTGAGAAGSLTVEGYES